MDVGLSVVMLLMLAIAIFTGWLVTLKLDLRPNLDMSTRKRGFWLGTIYLTGILVVMWIGFMFAGPP